jgi:hypothetical protein
MVKVLGATQLNPLFPEFATAKIFLGALNRNSHLAHPCFYSRRIQKLRFIRMMSRLLS